MGAKTPTMTPWVYFGSCAIVDTFARLILRMRVYGLENIPRTGAAIIAINHVSNADPPLIGSQAGRVRYCHSIGKKELFSVPVLKWWLHAVGSIPLDRDRSDPGAMRAALDVLEAGNLFIMAPEGTRGKTGRPRTPKPGVAFLAHHAGAPIIPVRIHGTEGIPLPGRVWMRFGKPIRCAPKAAGGTELNQEYRAFAEDLMKRIYAMTEEGEAPSD